MKTQSDLDEVDDLATLEVLDEVRTTPFTPEERLLQSANTERNIPHLFFRTRSPSSCSAATGAIKSTRTWETSSSRSTRSTACRYTALRSVSLRKPISRSRPTARLHTNSGPPRFLSIVHQDVHRSQAHGQPPSHLRRG